MRILVTGGAGFIGSHLCERLVSEGHVVKVLDNMATGDSKNLAKLSSLSDFEYFQGSILDLDSLTRLMGEVDYVFHLAAAVGVFNIVNNPLSSLLTNIRGTENVLESASAKGIPVFLTSSSEVYGKNISDSLKEGDDRILGNPLKLRWSYSEATAIDESLAYAYFIEKNLETRIVRFFNTVGPRQLGAYGMVVPRFVRSALKNEPISIYGDGMQSRVFCHVDDAIEALLALVGTDKTANAVYNVGGTGEITIKELAVQVIKETKSQSSIEFIPYEKAYAPGFEDMQRRVPDISKIKQELNWAPKKNLSQIIADVAAHISNS